MTDRGLQPERTRLAWQRTALTALAALLVVERLLFTVSVVASVLVATAAVLALAGLGWAVVRGRRDGVTDGRTLVLPAVVAVLSGFAALAYALVG